MFHSTVQLEQLTLAIASRVVKSADDAEILTRGGSKKFQECEYFEHLWTESQLQALTDAPPMQKLKVVAAVANGVGIVHPSNATTARIAIFLAVKGYKNMRPTPTCLNEYQRKLQKELTILRTTKPFPFKYEVAIGKPSDFEPEVFTSVFGEEVPMDPPQGLSELMNSIQYHGPKFSRKTATALVTCTSDAQLTLSAPHPSAQSSAPPTLTLDSPSQQQQQQQMMMNLGMMAMNCMLGGGGQGAMGGMFGGGGGGCMMPGFGACGGMFGGGGGGVGGMNDGGAGDEALGEFKPHRREPAALGNGDGARDDHDPIEAAKRRMAANDAAAQAGAGSKVPPTGKKAKTAIRELTKKQAVADANDENVDEGEEENEKDEASEEESDDDEEEEDEEEKETVDSPKHRKKPAAAMKVVKKAAMVVKKAAFSKVELASTPTMPTAGSSTTFLGAKIYLSKNKFRIIMHPPNYATERTVQFVGKKPTNKDLKAVKAKIIECKVKV